MKSAILIFALILFSCNKEEIDKTTEPAVDCNCDRVVAVNQFNYPDGTSWGTYSTVNDCSNQTKNLEWQGIQNKPVIGSCK
jgi:hypothetical protein